MKTLKKMLAFAVSFVMIFSCITAVNVTTVSAAPSISGGWYETIYAEWADNDPDSAKVEYKLSSASAYTALTGDDAKFLIRQASTSGYGRVDIPGLKEGVYDLKITASDGTVHERKGINVLAHDRSGYAHWNREADKYDYAKTGVGAYKDDGTPKDKAIIVYVTDENKDTVTIPGYENKVYNYSSSTSGATWTRTCEGIGNILNNNMKFIDELTKDHPLIIRLVGKVNVPKNLTPYDAKDNALGGSKGDNGNLAITKYGRNITIEGIGDDAEVDGWGFTFSQSSTCPDDAGISFEVRNITFRNYTEDALGFQGDDPITDPILRVWVHNNVFYPGYANPSTASDKTEGDGSCDFKRGQYYTMSYNHYIKCHKTNLLGAGDSNDQFFMTLHHNWYESVASRQPLGAGGNVHIYNTYFQDKMTGGANKHDTSTVIDLRGKAAGFSENNYFEACKNCYNLRKNTSNLKVYNDIKASVVIGGKTVECTDGKASGTLTIAKTRAEAGLPDNGLAMPDGGSIANWDTNPKYFYCDAAGNTVVEKLDAPEDVPEQVMTYAGTLHEFPQVEFGTITITVTDEAGKAISDASVTASGLSFTPQSNGTYTARASLYSEYNVTVSKEGYENVVIKTTPIETNGGVFEGKATLKADTDGYAVVKLTGGSDNVPVKGAKVVLNNGAELKDQGDGTYKSDAQYAVTGTYSVTITNTGDYIAPTGAQAIAIKTTDAATEIHLDKAQGAVSVTLKAADGSEKALDTTNAVVFVGTKQLTNAGENKFTGTVDVGTAYAVTASVPGWQIASIEPAQITASVAGTAEAVVTLQEGGDSSIWDYTNGIGVDGEFFVFGGSKTWNDWKDAQKYPLPNPDDPDSSLTVARKVESSREITFNAPADGKLLIVAHDKGKGGASIELTNPDGTTTLIDVPSGGGSVTVDVKAGANMLKKGKNESELYYLKYTVTGDYVGPIVPPTPGGDDPTEDTTEAPVQSTPVDKGDAVSNNGEESGNISVVYDENTDSYKLTDKSKNLAAKLNIPLKETIKSGKVVVKGTATPTKASGSWALVSITGPADADGNYPEIAALAANGEKAKNVTLRVNADKDNGYSPSTDAIQANKVYEYEFIIDLDNKSVELTVNGIKYTNTVPINVTEIGGFAAITAVSDDARNLTVSNPYIGIVDDTPTPTPPDDPEPPVTEGLNDEYMWPVDTDLVQASDTTGMIELGEAFLANSEEDAAAVFTEGDQTYELWDWVQPKNDPHDSRGIGPMSPGTDNDPTGIPVSGGYLKFTPIADGVLTAAIKTNGSKATYITDEAGAVVYSKDQTNGDTTYDIVRINVKQGKSYYIFANGSKTCIYYLGYTSGGSVPTPPDPQEPEYYGDSDNDGKVEITDVEEALLYVLKGTPFSNEKQYLDVNTDNKIDSEDVAMILQHVLDSSYTLPRPAK